MSTPTADQATQRLIDAAFDGTISDTDRDELEARLMRDDAAVQAFVARSQLETALHFEIRSAVAARRVDVALAEIPGPQGTDGEAYTAPASRVEATLRRRGFRSGAGLVIAASLIAAVAWFSKGHAVIIAQRDPSPVARLESVDGAVWLGGDYPVGRRFVEGDSIYLTAGAARISMASGAEVELRAPCFVSLDDAMRVRLEEGDLTAQVADWAHGFTVETDALRVVDLGTKFAVSSSREGDAEAHVLDGQVRVHRSLEAVSESPGILLSGGEAVRLRGRSRVTTKIAADRERFDADLGDVAPYKPIPMFNTGRGLRPGEDDRHWRVVGGPTCSLYNGPRFATVCEADHRYLSNDPAHSQWISLADPVRPGAPENQTFTFENRFDLTGYDLESVVISAQVIADNGIDAVRINGRPAPIESWTLNERDQVFNRFHVLEIAEGFVPGENVVQFDVWNGVDRAARQSVNPLALRVEWRAFGRPAPVRTASDTDRRTATPMERPQREAS